MTKDATKRLPTKLLAQAIPMLTPHELASVVERLIERLDELDGDPEAEANGTEEDFVLAWYQQLPEPGCTIADPDAGVEDGPFDEDSDRELEEGEWAEFGIDHTTGPLPIAMSQNDAIKRPYLNRIRAERCVPVTWRTDWRTGQRYLDRRTGQYRFLTEPKTPTRRQLLKRKRKRGVPRKARP